LLISAALISAVFIRLLPALLVAPLAISRHEIIRVTALLGAPPPASAEIRLHAFRSERPCSLLGMRRREQFRSFKPKRKNMNTTRKTSSQRLQVPNNIVKPLKFPPQPQEWKIVSLRECPTPEAMQLCETPTQGG